MQTMSSSCGGSELIPGYDDWPTFGHDQDHTGCDLGNTQISTQDAAGLRKVWEFKQSEEIFASPIAVEGKVFVATMEPGTVIALDATTGKELWSTTIGNSMGEIRQTPVYDQGLLFVGVHGFGSPNALGQFPPVPSSIYALNADTGKVVWSALLQGAVRASPAVANGDVYVPVAGGDLPFCLQGGISAFNETTGQPVWNFFVDPTPADGGSVWSPVAYDGTRLIFGTGNTCTQTPLSANAIVALDPQSGSIDWQLNTAPQLSDADVGAGALIVGGEVVTVGKNGIIYYLDESTGAVLHTVQTNTGPFNGGFSTPATDGSTIILGTSSAPSPSLSDDESVQYFGRVKRDASSTGGELLALDLNGDVQWTIPTNSTVNSSVAIDDGVAFADINDSIEALNVANGNVLWSYGMPNGIAASPVVVKSGVYTADLAGNVYKFAL